MAEAISRPEGGVRVAIINPSDPAGIVAGGIDTFIRGLIAWAPPDIEYCVVGATTSPQDRPVGEWTRAQIGHRSFDFFAATDFDSTGSHRGIPITLRFSAALARHRPKLDVQVLEFHRAEPIINFYNDLRGKTAVFHQDIEVLQNPDSDIFWKHAPWLYHALEKKVVPRLGSLFCVKQSAASDYRQRYPRLAEHVHFLPTWFEPQTFRTPNETERQAAKAWLQQRFQSESDREWIVSVGRLDSQKDPQLLLRTFRELLAVRPKATLIFIGTGVLEPELRDEAADLGSRVIFAGLMSPEEISQTLMGADLVAMTSAYEGMPIAVLEALACGLPVMTTEVGEVRLVVKHRRNGYVATARTQEEILTGMRFCLEQRDILAGAPCRSAVEPYSPQQVLSGVYENYRRLAVDRRA